MLIFGGIVVIVIALISLYRWICKSVKKDIEHKSYVIDKKNTKNAKNRANKRNNTSGSIITEQLFKDARDL